MTTLLRILGIAIFVTGILLFGFGFNSSQSPVEKGIEKTIGRYSEGTIWYLVCGTVLTIGGGALFLNARRISKEK